MAASSRKVSSNRIDGIHALTSSPSPSTPHHHNPIEEETSIKHVDSYTMKSLSSKLFNHFSSNKKDKNDDECVDDYDDEDEENFENDLQFFFEYENDEDNIEVNDDIENMGETDETHENRRRVCRNGEFNESFSSLAKVYSMDATNTNTTTNITSSSAAAASNRKSANEEKYQMVKEEKLFQLKN